MWQEDTPAHMVGEAVIDSLQRWPTKTLGVTYGISIMVAAPHAQKESLRIQLAIAAWVGLNEKDPNA